MTQKKSRPGAKGARKVKTGCQTCKTRRKKCDEVRPACSQCKSTGWPCDFATNQGLPRGDICIRETPVPLEVGFPAVRMSHSTSPELDSHLFNYFQLVVGKEFALFFDDRSWEQFLLQMAHTDPIIQHASLAVSALSLDHSSAGSFWRGSRQICSALDYSTQHYNSTIRRLNGGLGLDVPDPEVFILGILMLIHLEFMRGDQAMVSVHLRGAAALLKCLTQRGTMAYSRNFGSALGYISSQLRELESYDTKPQS